MPPVVVPLGPWVGLVEVNIWPFVARRSIAICHDRSQYSIRLENNPSDFECRIDQMLIRL